MTPVPAATARTEATPAPLAGGLPPPSDPEIVVAACAGVTAPALTTTATTRPSARAFIGRPYGLPRSRAGSARAACLEARRGDLRRALGAFVGVAAADEHGLAAQPLEIAI